MKTTTMYGNLTREVAQGYTDGDLEVKVVVTIRSQGEIVHRVTEYMTNELDDDALINALSTALKLSSGTLDLDTEE